MAIDTSQLIRDAECLLPCVPQGMVEAAQLALMIQPTVLRTTTFAVSSDGVRILTANPSRRSAIIQNAGGLTTAFVGPSTVTTSGSTQGLALGPAAAPANSIMSRLVTNTTGELYAASTGTSIRVLEFLTS